MPSDDVSDLRDVVDAINKLCDNMKTSSYDEEFDDSKSGSVDLAYTPSVDLIDLFVAEEIVPEEAVLAEVESDPDWYVACQVEPADPSDVIFKKVEHYNTETWRQSVSRLEIASPEDVVVREAETYVAETWSDLTLKSEQKETNRWSDSSMLEIVSDTAIQKAAAPAEWSDPSAVKKNETQDRWSDPTSRLEIVSSEEAIRKAAAPAERWSDPSAVKKNETQDRWSDPTSRLEIVSPEETIHKAETAERWSDSSVSLQQVEEEVTSDERPHEFSEMYYTASSEVSLLSDLEDRPPDEPVVVIAGHVAAMRERFESMTRTNTPCPDLVRSASPSLDLFRNVTPSPDRLG